MKFLVIDDSKTMRIILAKALGELGHSVEEAGDGKAGLERLKTIPDLGAVFVDWNMPEMNGLDFVVEARRHLAGRRLPIVMVTTENEMENVKKALSSGASEFLMKPFTKDSIKEKLTILGLT